MDNGEMDNGLKEVVQDPFVKPKLQCLMVDPSFSMVTVQSEDSGIVWETASSRCSTPWASEASSPSDVYSLESSGTQGNIVIIMDEDKIKRRKKTSKGDRFRRRLSGAAIGEERPAMVEVSVPNVRPENSEDGQSAEAKTDKDQELFNLISEGFEILNIVVPSKLPTVDEEDSTELTDNLSYLEDSPKIKSKCKQTEIAETEVSSEDATTEGQETDEGQKVLSQESADQSKKEESDLDYLEKFTLLDETAPCEIPEKPEPEKQVAQAEEPQPQVPQEKEKVEEKLDEESFVIISDVEIASEHLDEVFYGAKCHEEPEILSHRKEDGKHLERQSSKSLKECGATLFGSQECILTPVYLPSGPPKIIDQNLLDEPRALSYHYSDLYEDAVGDRKREDDFSDVESVISEKSFKRRFSESDDDGYLEKFTLKDHTEAIEDTPDEDISDSDRMIWPQNKFEMTGCLIRVEPKEEEVPDSQSKLEAKDVTDCTVEIEETIIIKKEKVSGKGHQHKKTQESAKPDLVAKTDEKVLILPKPQKQLPAVEKEVPVKALEPEKKEMDKTKPSDEKVLILPQKEVPQKKVPPKEIPQKEHPVVDKGVHVKAPVPEVEKTKPSEEKMIILPQTEVLEKEHPLVEKDVHVKASVPEKTEVEKTKPSEEKMIILPQTEVREKEHPVVEKDIHVKAPVPEITKVEQTKPLDEKVLILPQKEVPEKEHPIVKKEVLVKALVPEITKVEQAKPLDEKVLILPQKEVPEKEHPIVEKEVLAKALVPEKREVDKTKPSEENVIILPKKEVLEKEHPVLEKEVSVVALAPEKIEVEKTKPSNEKGLILPKKECPVVEKEVPAKALVTEKTEVEKTQLSDKKAIGLERKCETEVIEKSEVTLPALAHIPDVEAKMKVSTKAASVSTPVPCEIEVVHKETKSEIKEDVAVDLTRKEGTGQVPELVLHAAPTEVKVDASKLAEQKTNESTTEIKSKKVLLKDTHKENIWRTLEPITPSPPVEMQDSSTMRVSPLEDEEFVENGKLKRGTGLFSTLRSFTPHEDLSGFGCDTAELDLSKEIIEEPDYEMVSKQEARQSESEAIAGTEHLKPDVLVQDKSAEETLEESYDFIEELDGAQESELGRLIEDIEIQPMDAFCLVCRCPILMSDAGHQNHEVSSLDKAFEDIKSQLSNWISVLQEKAENIEDMVSELELAYNSVEEHCKDSEKAVDEQNEEVLKLVMDQYNEMSQAMEDEKKVKLEQLYDQIVSFQSNIDTAKETMEQTAKEMEETDDLAFASSYKEIDMRLKTALESTMSLELGPRGLLVFEDYAKGTTANEKKNRQVIPVPQQPRLQPQEANSATSTSVTVYWTINEGDIIDCFQVYCMEEPQGAVSEEYRVTVKESYCNLEELEPDKCYKVWVMAVNYTGCSLPSERLPFRTAPSVPVINPEACTVLWDSATLRWSSAQPSAVDSFTLEYCRQYAMEGEGLRSISGIKGYEQKVLLQPNENFLFYIKSVNAAGASEQSEAALISTRGSRFHLLTETANAVLKVFEDRNSVEYPQETYNQMSTLIECPAVMGELLPRVGYHYWETVVADCRAYRIGVAYQTAPQDSAVGDNSASWCLHCVPTSISCRFELLHDKVESDIFVMDVPRSIGTLLDFTQGRLVFFNAQNGQCLGSFQQSFRQPCHPVFVLETAGRLELKMTMEVPEFAKHW
uniref:Cardiomyopathy associated 5 n=1 Tax=Astyanax mexicanus TaxID=7994 RepID=A0A8B9J706_ASTMX